MTINPFAGVSGTAAPQGAEVPDVWWGETHFGTSKQKSPKPSSKTQAIFDSIDGGMVGQQKGNGDQRSIKADEADRYIAYLRSSSPGQYTTIVDRMRAAGLVGPDATFKDVQAAWSAAVDFSADSYKQGVKINPYDAIDLLGNPADGGNKAKGFSRSSTTTINDVSRNVDLSSPQEARAWLMQAAERQLGRAPSGKELQAFRAALNGMENANAEVRRTTGTRSNSEQGVEVTSADGTASSTVTSGSSSDDTNTTQTGGMDRAQYAMDYARSAGDYAEYQAATTYMDALFSAIQSPGGA